MQQSAFVKPRPQWKMGRQICYWEETHARESFIDDSKNDKIREE
jgi:hypothetical protein